MNTDQGKWFDKMVELLKKTDSHNYEYFKFSPLPNLTSPQNNICPQPNPVYLRRGAATDYVIMFLEHSLCILICKKILTTLV